MNISDDLRAYGFVPTGEESPIDEDGELWRKNGEIVCDETATVIDGNHYGTTEEEEVYTYYNSGRVKLIGGFFGSYDGDGIY